MPDLSLATKLLYSAGSVGTGAFYSFNNFVLPPILKSFGAPDLLIGLLSSTRSIEGAVIQPTIGALSDRAIETSLPGCGTLAAIHNRGWLWLLDRTTARQDLVAGDGVVACSEGIITTFRARRVDMFALTLSPAQREVTSLSSLAARTGRP